MPLKLKNIGMIKNKESCKRKLGCLQSANKLRKRLKISKGKESKSKSRTRSARSQNTRLNRRGSKLTEKRGLRL